MPARAMRLAVTGSLVLGTLAAGGALAAPKAKPVCNLVKDAASDTFAARSQDTAGAYGPQEDAADIVSADVASDAKTVTGVVRVKSLAAAAATSPGGVSYDINFTTPSIASPAFIRALVPGSGEPVAEAGTRESVVATSVSTILGTGTTVVDKAKNEIRFSFPVALFGSAGGLKPGSKITFGDVTTGRAAAGRAVFADVANTVSTYTIGAPSCVVPGK